MLEPPVTTHADGSMAVGPTMGSQTLGMAPREPSRGSRLARWWRSLGHDPASPARGLPGISTKGRAESIQTERTEG